MSGGHVLFLPDFVAKTQSPSVPDDQCEEFTILLLDDFVRGDCDELLLCPIRALHKCLARTEKYYPDIFQFVHLYIPVEEEGVLKHHLLLLRSVINHAYMSASDVDC